MSTYTLGQAAYVNTGAYNSGTTYSPLNTVSYNGGTWVALVSSTGVTPGSDNTKWLCITQGIKSVVVAAGNTGYANITVTLTDGTSSTASVPVGAIGDGTITVAKLASGFLLPVAQGGTGASTASGALSSLGAQAAKKIRSVTLAANAWVSKSQTVDCSGTVYGSSTQLVEARPTAAADWDAAGDADLYPPTVGANDKLTFTCATTPTADIAVTVVIWD